MPYVRELDGLRAVAALAVLAFHCKLPAAGGGFIGVDVFFVLSGFLITRLLRQEFAETSRIAIGQFYLRRALRLWPALILMLAAYAAVSPALFGAEGVMRDVALSGLYLSDYARAFWGVPDYLNHTWSLSVEEHFYLLWPAVILLIGRRSDLAATALLISLFVLASAWQIVDTVVWQDWARTYYRFDTRMSGLLIGGVVAVFPWKPSSGAARAVGEVSLAILAAVVATGVWGSPASLTWLGVVVDLAAAGLVWSLASGHQTALGAMFRVRPLGYLGLVSYGVYLWHYPISRAVRDHYDPWTTSLIVLASSIALATLSFELVERPLKTWLGAKLRQRLA